MKLWNLLASTLFVRETCAIGTLWQLCAVGDVNVININCHAVCTTLTVKCYTPWLCNKQWVVTVLSAWLEWDILVLRSCQHIISHERFMQAWSGESVAPRMGSGVRGRGVTYLLGDGSGEGSRSVFWIFRSRSAFLLHSPAFLMHIQ